MSRKGTVHTDVQVKGRAHRHHSVVSKGSMSRPPVRPSVRPPHIHPIGLKLKLEFIVPQAADPHTTIWTYAPQFNTLKGPLLKVPVTGQHPS